jgi:hypothetical protein
MKDAHNAVLRAKAIYRQINLVANMGVLDAANDDAAEAAHAALRYFGASHHIHDALEVQVPYGDFVQLEERILQSMRRSNGNGNSKRIKHTPDPGTRGR